MWHRASLLLYLGCMVAGLVAGGTGVYVAAIAPDIPRVVILGIIVCVCILGLIIYVVVLDKLGF